MGDLKDGECYIPSVMANENGLKIGDKVSLVYGDKEYKYKVKAIYADCYNLNSSFQLELILIR